MRFATSTAMFVCLAATSVAISADAFWNSPDAYLGEAPPSDVPKIFAPGRLVEPGSFTMGRVAFSQDGRAFYYTQSDSWTSDEHAKLLTVRFADHKWSKPILVAEKMMSPTVVVIFR